MSIDIEDPPEQTAASLVSGIIGDLQNLVEQQFQLTRREIEAELQQRAAAATLLGLGIAVFFLDAIVVCMSLAHLMHWAASPPETDPAWLPLWGCYAAVAAGLGVIGGIVAQVGRVWLRSIVPCQNPATQIVQRNAP